MGEGGRKRGEQMSALKRDDMKWMRGSDEYFSRFGKEER